MARTVAGSGPADETNSEKRGADTGDKSKRTLSNWQLASYGAPAMPLSMVALPMAVYLPAVYADSEGFGLGLAFVGLMMVLSRVFDGITDPLIGFISDRIRTPWGRRKPFVVIGTPIYIAGICLLFIPPIEFTEVEIFGTTMNTGYPWMLGALILTYIGATIKDVPYSAWGAELTTNYNERTLVTSWREGFTVAGSLIGAFTPAIIFFFGYDKPIDSVYFLSLGIAFAMPILVANCVISAPEHRVIETRKEHLRLRDSFRYVWRNDPYRRLVIIFLFSMIGSAMTNTLSFFFVKHVLLAGDDASLGNNPPAVLRPTECGLRLAILQFQNPVDGRHILQRCLQRFLGDTSFSGILAQSIDPGFKAGIAVTCNW